MQIKTLNFGGIAQARVLMLRVSDFHNDIHKHPAFSPIHTNLQVVRERCFFANKRIIAILQTRAVPCTEQNIH